MTVVRKIKMISSEDEVYDLSEYFIDVGQRGSLPEILSYSEIEQLYLNYYQTPQSSRYNVFDRPVKIVLTDLQPTFVDSQLRYVAMFEYYYQDVLRRFLDVPDDLIVKASPHRDRYVLSSDDLIALGALADNDLHEAMQESKACLMQGIIPAYVWRNYMLPQLTKNVLGDAPVYRVQLHPTNSGGVTFDFDALELTDDVYSLTERLAYSDVQLDLHH